MICVAKVGIFSYILEAMRSLPDLAAFFYAWTLAVDTFFDFEPQKRSRVTKLGAQTQHRVIQRFLSPFTSKQSEITCARDEGVVSSNIGQAISGSTVWGNRSMVFTLYATHPQITRNISSLLELAIYWKVATRLELILTKNKALNHNNNTGLIDNKNVD